jgi:hypothetical protein
MNPDPTPHSSDLWPALAQADWADTCATLQLWIQIVGKVRMVLTPPINHSWNVTLYPTIDGFTTSLIASGSLIAQIDLDILDRLLVVRTMAGGRQSFSLGPMSVADFYQKFKASLNALDILVRIWDLPAEVPNPIPFHQDFIHRSYDREYAERFWRVTLETTRIFTIFRSRFRGKVSPVHLFWGAMDLACTRFSGRKAPEHASMPGLPDRVTRDAYSHEVSSCGFWPGAPGFEPMFYSYAYPEPPGYAQYPIGPVEAAYNSTLGEFVLPYEAVRNAREPEAMLLQFLQSTYDAAANCAHWDRDALDVPSAAKQ